jgi:hypothetical protein
MDLFLGDNINVQEKIKKRSRKWNAKRS